ncbi:YSIRK-type signal peptide-containing protein, partial [Streptococcus agalactiae]
MRGKQQDFRTEKYIRYGIRKFSFGAASIAIAVGSMFLGNGVVSAMEVQPAETPIIKSASSQGDKETKKAEPNETVETVNLETEKAATVPAGTATGVEPTSKSSDLEGLQAETQKGTLTVPAGTATGVEP